MGRHRRASAASRSLRSTAAPAASPTARGRHRGTPRRRRGPAPLRTGLLSASAAMAMGAVAVASGLLPGPDGVYVEGYDGPGGRIPVDGLTELHGSDPQGLTGIPGPGTGTDADRRDGDTRRSTTSPGRTGTPERTAAGRGDRSSRSDAPQRTDDDPTGATPTSPTPSSSPGRTSSGSPSTPHLDGTRVEEAAEAEVLRLVNQERARAGCRPLTSDPGLAQLADRFSRLMATQRFFSHVAPDGSTPWDRAERLGIDNLAAENIARGQRTAAAVVESWMDSPAHRANILECDYTTLGVGVHFGSGGPWWTQEFGY